MEKNNREKKIVIKDNKKSLKSKKIHKNYKIYKSENRRMEKLNNLPDKLI